MNIVSKKDVDRFNYLIEYNENQDKIVINL